MTSVVLTGISAVEFSVALSEFHDLLQLCAFARLLAIAAIIVRVFPNPMSSARMPPAMSSGPLLSVLVI